MERTYFTASAKRGKPQFPLWSFYAEGGSRTHNLVRGSVFETDAYASSATSAKNHGPERDRTAGLLNAIETLYQLSYRPESFHLACSESAMSCGGELQALAILPPPKNVAGCLWQN